jgi:hypothetical protein
MYCGISSPDLAVSPGFSVRGISQRQWGGDFGNSLRAASRHASEVDRSRLHAAVEALFIGVDGVTDTSIPQADID